VKRIRVPMLVYVWMYGDQISGQIRLAYDIINEEFSWAMLREWVGWLGIAWSVIWSCRVVSDMLIRQLGIPSYTYWFICGQ